MLTRLEVVVVAMALVAVAMPVLAQSQYDKGYGPNPELPKPESNWVPTVNVADAVGWSNDDKPKAAPLLDATAYASGLDHPRWLHVLPNGDVLVAESNKPEGASPSGIKSWFMKVFMGKAGAGVKSADRITLLRGLSENGRAFERHNFIEGLKSPFGMALIGNTLYVANADELVKFPYREGDTKISAAPEKVVDLPGKDLNHHWTKNIIASPDGSKLYVAVGSNSNAAENGIDKETDRAAILEIDLATSAKRVFASGLRNPVGLGFEPQSGALWTVVNERDELGNDLVPDYMTSVKDGAFYGWPYSYYGQNVDKRVSPQRPDLVATASVPDYALGAHTASLGLAFAPAKAMPTAFAKGVFIAQHGSWNREPPAGYRVVFVPFENGKPAGAPRDVLTGFLNSQGQAQGRPVGVAIDQAGALLVADDVGNTIWRVTASRQTSQVREPYGVPLTR